MTHLFHGATVAAAVLLCAAGVLPSDQFLELAKWVVILYTTSTVALRVVEAVRPQTSDLAIPAQGDGGVGLPLNSGIFEDDVFSDAIGDGVPRNYTSMFRDAEAPPVTTEGVDGLPVVVPVDPGWHAATAPGHMPTEEMYSEGLGRFDDGDPRFKRVFSGPRPPLPRVSPLIPPPNRGLAERERAQREREATVVVEPVAAPVADKTDA